MTEPRDRAPDDALEPIDVDDDVDAAGPAIDDADVDEIDEELLDEAEAEADEADEAIDDYEAARREVAGEPVDDNATVAPAERPSRVKGRAGTGAATRAPTPSEIAVHVKEDVSKVFVIAAVAVFIVILLNGLLLGTGGLLRPLATPTPSPSPSSSASPSSSPSGSPSSSPSGSPSSSPADSPSLSPTASPAPSAS